MSRSYRGIEVAFSKRWNDYLLPFWEKSTQEEGCYGSESSHATRAQKVTTFVADIVVVVAFHNTRKGRR